MKTLDELRFFFGMHIKPFHDDETLQGFIKAVIEESKPEAFIETGTYRGASLQWVAKQFSELPCLSCETDIYAYRYSKIRLVPFSNVEIANQTSPRFLRPNLWRFKSAVFFLDAHGESWPLLEELGLIRHWNGKAVIIVDDFDSEKPGFPFITIKGIKCDKYLIRYAYEGPIWVPDYQPNQDSAGYAILFQGVEPPANFPFFSCYRKLV